MSDRVNVLFFARLREALPQAKIEFPWTETDTVAALRQALVAQGPEWTALKEDTLVAVNQDIAAPGQLVAPGDEVAFFPPVTGG